jgi:hypothetical protein
MLRVVTTGVESGPCPTSYLVRCRPYEQSRGPGSDRLDGVRFFSTIRERHVVPLAMRMTRMWEYTDPMNPDQLSPKKMPSDEVWSWVELVLKVCN